jgi:hypothetical protein
VPIWVVCTLTDSSGNQLNQQTYVNATAPLSGPWNVTLTAPPPPVPATSYPGCTIAAQLFLVNPTSAGAVAQSTADTYEVTVNCTPNSNPAGPGGGISTTTTPTP